MERYSILYSSKTGNTELLAKAIQETLPNEDCDYFGSILENIPESSLLFIGFWTDKGTADNESLTLLSKLRNRKIFLFGTAGFGGSDAYFKAILEKVKVSIDQSNTVIGEYRCQGKRPASVKERYLKRKERLDAPKNLDRMIANFDKASSHPDNRDLDSLKKLVADIFL